MSLSGMLTTVNCCVLVFARCSGEDISSAQWHKSRNHRSKE